MGDRSGIEWTDATLNVVTGCDKVSRGCDNCYAQRFAERFRGVEGHPFEQGFDLRLWPERLSLPGRWRRPRRVFVNSMSDLFHKEVPWSLVDDLFDVMEDVDRHVYQILTKRSSLMVRYLRRRYGSARCPEHIWCGVSVEDRRALVRVHHLREAPAESRFLSCEPLLQSLGRFSLSGIGWVIAGGESGPGHRPLALSDAAGVRDLCSEAGVPFLFKQVGGIRAKSGGRELEGRVHDAYPASVVERTMPALALAV